MYVCVVVCDMGSVVHPWPIRKNDQVVVLFHPLGGATSDQYTPQPITLCLTDAGTLEPVAILEMKKIARYQI